MKREIKFRRVHYNDESKTKVISVTEWGIFGDSFKAPSHVTSSFYFEDYQYTGLKDKNGKEIYEGDILKYKNKESESISFVVWSLDGWRFNSYMCIGTPDLYPYVDTTRSHDRGMAEVIGNVYQHPELLKA